MIKKLITFSVEKSILNHIFFLFFLILGIFAYNKIPKEIFPPSSLDAISITGSYSGASSDILDKMVVKSLEDDLKNISDINKIESIIKSGFFRIKAELKEGSDVDEVLSDVKDIVTNIKRDLPTDMNEPSVKISKHFFPLVTIAIASYEDKEKLLEVARELKSELSSIGDLAEISIRGDADKELVFLLEDKKIEALGLNRSEIINSISSISSIFPIGMIKEKGNHLFLSTYSGLKELKDIKETIIVSGGKRFKIGDVAKVSYNLSDPTEVSHFNAIPNISVNINKAKTGNAIALVKQIKNILKKYEQKYKEYKFDVYTDTSIWIKNRLNTVISNIIFGLILVTLSIYIFINGRIAFVVGVGIPTSFFIGLIATQMMGYSLNMLSLLGALIALGMLVDEAIVVAENIYRHLENGDDPKTAAINGATEMFPAVLTATATTIFAFLPLLIMSGEMGIFIKILPIMISILLLSSLFEAFYFLPLHAKEILRKRTKEEKSAKFWKWIKDKYTNVLAFVLKFRFISLGVFLIFTIGGTIIMLKNSKFQLFPTFDTTQIYVSGKVNHNYSIKDTQKLVTEVEKVLLLKLSKSDVSSITSVSGMKLDAKFRPEMSENFFHIFVNLHERAPENFFNKFINPLLSPEYDDSDMIREKSAQEIGKIIEKITEKFTKDKNFEEFNVVVPGTGVVESDIEISFVASDKLANEAIEKLEKKMQNIDGVYNITNDMIEGRKELKLKINSYGATLGFNEKMINNTLRMLFAKAEISKMYYKGELIKIKSQDSKKDYLQTLENLYINVPNSFQKVRLSDIVDFIYLPNYTKIHKEDGKKIWSVYGSLDKNKITSAEFLKQIDLVLHDIEKDGVEVIIKGEEKENQKIQKEMAQAAIIALFLIFLALVWMFDSLLLSVFVLSVIPLSIFGVLVGHIIMGMNLTMPGMLGIVGLSGVVVNDGIIMIDFIKKAKNYQEFIQKATMRLRPILLTSVTTILGLSTLIFFAAGQAVILQPMAISLGFGIAWATVLNLLFLPLLYSIVNGIKK